MKNKMFVLWLSCLLTLAILAVFSCMEGDGLALDANGYCQPTDINSYAICPELCNPRNKAHFCYCDDTDINDTCLACDVTLKGSSCYDSCKVKVLDPATGLFTLNDTCKQTTPNGAGSGCPKDPLNPCTPECADLRTIDYTTQIAPIWESGQCKAACHLGNGTAMNLTGNRRPVTLVYGGETIKTQRYLSLDPKDKPIHRLVNMRTWEDSNTHPIWRVRPFYPDSSYLVHILKGPGKNGKVQMPSELPPIPKSDLDAIEQWIKEGACPSP